MKTKESLKLQIERLSNLKENWGSYEEFEITIPSIMTAHKIIDELPIVVNLDSVNVFPMRNGGVQIEIGNWKEIEILNYSVTEIKYDSYGNILSKCFYEKN